MEKTQRKYSIGWGRLLLRFKGVALMEMNCTTYFWSNSLATSHDRFPPNGGLVREPPLFQGNLAW